MITYNMVKDFLKSSELAIKHPQEAQKFYDIFGNLPWWALMEANSDDLPTMFESFVNDIETENAIRVDNNRKAQYWDFIYSQMGGMELREYFTEQRKPFKGADDYDE